MAYKNQKKNKKHQAEIQMVNRRMKHYREKERRQKRFQGAATQQDFEREMRKAGLI